MHVTVYHILAMYESVVYYNRSGQVWLFHIMLLIGTVNTCSLNSQINTWKHHAQEQPK